MKYKTQLVQQIINGNEEADGMMSYGTDKTSRSFNQRLGSLTSQASFINLIWFNENSMYAIHSL